MLALTAIVAGGSAAGVLSAFFVLNTLCNVMSRRTHSG
jgi:hypothetical protein